MARRNRVVAVRFHESDYDMIDKAGIIRQLPLAVWARRVLVAAAQREIDRYAKIGDGSELVAPFYGDAAREAAIGGDSRSEGIPRSGAETVSLPATFGAEDGHPR